ncbi:MAG: ArnT family glycosyltransferase [Anaerolineae bacterium]
MRNRLFILSILLAAAVLRLHRLTALGLEHDEVANWLIDRSILDQGNYAVYYTAAYGHEAGFHYLQAAFVALVGDHALALRLPAAFAGLLLVAVSYALARRMFSKDTALISAGLLAILFWPVFYSRLGLRAITLPLLSGLSAYFWWRAWRLGTGTRRLESKNHPVALSPHHLFTLSGLFAGLSLHTYMAGRAVPLFYGLFITYLAIFHWPDLKRRWHGILLFTVVMTAVSAPLFLYLQTNPGAEFRITEIDAPLRALQEGNIRPVLENSLKVLGMFGFRGDPLWRQNIAGLPVFEPIIATLFYLSLTVNLWRLQDSRYAFLLLWLLTSAIPSIVTINAPSTIRIINSLPILTLFPAQVIHISGQLSTVFPKLSTETPKIGGKLILTILLLYYIGGTVKNTFTVWPQNDEVQFVWQAALTDTAAYLDTSSDLTPTAIGGWSPATMDPPTMALSMRRDDLSLRYFGSDSMTAPINTLILPKESDAVRIIRPNIREFAPDLEAQLILWGAKVERRATFTLYTLHFPPPLQPQYPDSANFEDQLLFLGYDAPSPNHLITYWQVVASPTGSRRFFLHLLDANGNIISQHDSLDAPAMHWKPGDILVQHHALEPDTAVPVRFRLGVYNPDTCTHGPCQNLLADDGAPFLLLPVNRSP